MGSCWKLHGDTDAARTVRAGTPGHGRPVGEPCRDGAGGTGGPGVPT